MKLSSLLSLYANDVTNILTRSGNTFTSEVSIGASVAGIEVVHLYSVANGILTHVGEMTLVNSSGSTSYYELTLESVSGTYRSQATVTYKNHTEPSGDVSA